MGFWLLLFLVIVVIFWTFVALRHFVIIRFGVVFPFAETNVLLSGASIYRAFQFSSFDSDCFCVIGCVSIFVTGVQIAHNYRLASL